MTRTSITKIVLVVAILISLVANAVLLLYSGWRSDFFNELKAGSQLAQTDKGVIEYASVGDKKTEKNHLLILHGTPGGYDGGRILADWLELDEQTHIIIPSRPGYLRTPAEVGLTPAKAADAMIALLDKLDIKKTTVLGWSGGGATAIELAQRYSTRIDGLVLLSPRVMADNKYKFKASQDSTAIFDPAKISVSHDFWGPDLIAYSKSLGFKLLPNWFFAHFFPANVASMDLTLQRLEQLGPTTLPPSLREMGRQNDYWHFAALPAEPKFDINIPTLIIHSPIDAVVSIEHARYLRKAIPGAELYVVENESHFSTMNAQAVGRFHTFLERLRQ